MFSTSTALLTLYNTASVPVDILQPGPLPLLILTFRAQQIESAKMPGRTSGEEMKYQGGEDYADPVKVEHGILAEFLTDFKALHSKGKVVSTAQTLLEVARGSGKPVDDKKMTVCHISQLEYPIAHGTYRWKSSSESLRRCLTLRGSVSSSPTPLSMGSGIASSTPL